MRQPLAELPPDPSPSLPPHDAGFLRELYDRYAEDVYRVAYRLTGSREDAEDVVQDVFVGLPEALRGYEERGQFGAWIRKVGSRVALMKLRRASRERQVPLESAPELPGPRGTDLRVDAIDLQRALDALPETLRAVLVLKELEGYSHEEIGQMLGIRPGASKVRLHRARDGLRQLLRRT